jgi:hypothetical protein
VAKSTEIGSGGVGVTCAATYRLLCGINGRYSRFPATVAASGPRLAELLVY